MAYLIPTTIIGESKCPNCGMIGDQKKEQGISFFRCPLCNAEFTKEMMLSEGEEVSLTNN